VFDRLRAAVNAALDAAMPPPDLRDLAGQMRRAAVEGRAALMKLKEMLATTERELVIERQHLDDARRRGALAQGIGDTETADIAGRFVTRHAERVAVLEQKLAAQRAELALAERDVEEMVGQLKELERRGDVPPAAAGPGVQPGLGALDAEEAELLKSQMDRAARETAADERLRELKKRMGK
jgi:hypothetical protein